MQISATSALVLHWADPALWQSSEAQAYLERLDLREGDALLKLFSEKDHYMHLQTVSGRKHFILHRAWRFLGDLHHRQQPGQVVVLAAGLAPLSLEIAARYPAARVFDVDKHGMETKKELAGGRQANVSFISCDITDMPSLEKGLREHGFDAAVPTLFVLEGIVYYLAPEHLLALLKYAAACGGSVAGDYCLLPEHVNEKTRDILTHVFDTIRQQVGLPFVQFYSDMEIVRLFTSAGHPPPVLTNMRDVQQQRTGSVHPFDKEDSSWVKLFEAS